MAWTLTICGLTITYPFARSTVQGFRGNSLRIYRSAWMDGSDWRRVWSVWMKKIKDVVNRRKIKLIKKIACLSVNLKNSSADHDRDLTLKIRGIINFKFGVFFFKNFPTISLSFTLTIICRRV